jgi:exopolysaccharide biosynthesis polyprenyl glycosylphosphotransferase
MSKLSLGRVIMEDSDYIREEELLLADDKNFDKNYIYIILKRVLDIIGSIIGMVLFSPIMLFTAVAIKITSPGPVVFYQKRVGLNGKVFNLYKFRSMTENAEQMLDKLKDKNEMSGPMFKIKEDPRVTKIGKFIRKTSIDELPQLINILNGEMSLVGPRPNLPREVIKFTKYQKQKIKVKPGLTCYWQVMGRNNIDFDDWMELDIKYVKERNTWIDIKLILQTVKVLFGDENAR